MQLRSARLCLDCEEVHDAQQCPVCSSETFAFITRWVPAPERREHARPPAQPPPQAETYRQLLEGETSRPSTMWWVRRGVVGLAAITIARYLWPSGAGQKPRPGNEH